jgi:hypothetical protein
MSIVTICVTVPLLISLEKDSRLRLSVQELRPASAYTPLIQKLLRSCIQKTAVQSQTACTTALSRSTCQNSGVHA